MDFFGAYTTLLIISLCSILLFLRSSAAEEPSDAAESTGLLLQTIEGKVTIDGAKSEKWLTTTFVSVDGGRYHGFLKANGEFEIHGVVPGSYLVEVVAENYVFEPQRVDISSKSGRVRARKANFLNSKTIDHLPYPLKFRTGNQAEFFEKREPWSIISTLKNPMVLLLVAPMILMLIIPRLMKGMNPEDQKVSIYLTPLIF
jgi:hypothetical protein